MEPTNGYYSVIQYCPDLARAECANVGVLLFCPEIGYIEAKLAQGNDRIRRFFGPDQPDLDTARINAAKRAIEHRLRLDRGEFRKLEDLMAFINTRANDLRITQPRPMKIVQPENELEKLFAELVGGRPEREARKPLFPDLDRAFESLYARLPNRTYREGLVPVPKLGGKLEINYGFHNGALTWVRTQRFQGDHSRITETASTLAMKSLFLSRFSPPDNPQRLIVVSMIPPGQQTQYESSIVDMFCEIGERLVTQDQVPKFIDEIQRQAH